MKAAGHAGPGINIHLSPSLISELSSRMLRITGALARWGVFTHIYLVAMADRHSPRIVHVDATRTVCRLSTSFEDSRNLFKRLLRFLSWYLSVFRRFRGEHIACINCHSLSTLPLGVILKAMTGARLVYDTHELETETLNMIGFRRALAKAAEAICMRFVDRIVVVGPRIGEWYEQRYPNSKPVVIRNLPDQVTTYERHTIFREKCGIPGDSIVFFYQGLLGMARGVEIALEAFKQAPPDRHIVFLGFGPLSSMIEAYAKQHDNIHFLPAVPPSQLRQYTQSGDVGLCMIEPACLSYEYSFPNKLFEYFGAGIPAIVSNLPDLSHVIGSSGGGWIVENDPAQLLQLILSIQPSDTVERGKRAIDWAQRNSWPAECEILHEMYRQLHFFNTPSA